jgi:F-type H+-transporting ATPase subunit delta
MSEIKISRRYANALYEFSVEQKMADVIFNDMTLVYNSCKSSKDLVNFLKSPIIKYKKKAEILKVIFGDKISEVTLNFMSIISKGRRESLLPVIAEQFIAVYKKAKGIKTATVKTAVKLDDKLRKEIIESLEKQTGSKIELNEVVKEDLIGGFVISVDNKEIDTSLKSRLNRLRKDFESNLYIRQY